jgi:hypothetical protein
MLPVDDEEDQNKNPFGQSGMEMGVVNNYQGADNIYGQNSQNGFWTWENSNYNGYGHKEYGYVPPNQYKEKTPKPTEASKPAVPDPHHPANVN